MTPPPEGVARLDAAVDADGQASPRVLELAALNAGLQTGLAPTRSTRRSSRLTRRRR